MPAEYRERASPACPSFAFVERASTHTGTNVENSLHTLGLLGLPPGSQLAVVQQPQLHRRTCLTWTKQMRASSPHYSPIGWTVRPTRAATGRSTAELLHCTPPRIELCSLLRSPSPAHSLCTPSHLADPSFDPRRILRRAGRAAPHPLVLCGGRARVLRRA